MVGKRVQFDDDTWEAIEAVIQFAQDQKILSRKVSPEEMFASNTLNLE